MNNLKEESLKKILERKRTDIEALSKIEDIIDDARNGHMFILVDDEDRENEGDLVIPAQMATPNAVNFMAKYGRGLICLALEQKQIDQLGLSLMPRSHSNNRFETAFTTSIEAREGVTTGISAPDRAHTIATAINEIVTPNDIVTPGHIFPLAARKGGTLVRTGHTEAAVDIAKLAGLNPSGVICEIMNDDGEMARLPELISFAQFHGLKIGSIADLIAYRLQNDRLVKQIARAPIATPIGGEFDLRLFTNITNYAEHVVLIKGDISGDKPVLVRMHALNLLDDLLLKYDPALDFKPSESILHAAMKQISEEGRGVIVLIREPRATALSSALKDSAIDSINISEHDIAVPAEPIREYGVGAQILRELGIKKIELLTNADRPVIGLSGYGLSIEGRRSI